METFYNFLKDKNKLFFKKTELRKYYKEFKKIWELDVPFETILNTLRKTKITYLLDNYWALSKNNPLVLANKFLDYLNINNYYGLETALYFNKKTWQPQLVYKLLNTKYQRIRTINKIKIEFIKINSSIFNNETLVKNEISYSDYEKTILDMIFKKNQKFYEPLNFEKINLYLNLYEKFPEVKATLIESLPSEKRRLIR